VDSEALVVITISVVILAGVAIIWMAMHSRRHIREMQHRERLAMIERGLVPPPEVDPATFERQTGIAPTPESQGAVRARSAGVIMMGLGLALLFLIAFAGGAPGVGIGVGGAFALLGAAFFFNALLMARSNAYSSRPPTVLEPRSGDRTEPPRTS